MDLRRATLTDAEAIRQIYNSAVVNSTATFDLVPRTVEEHSEWMEEHDGVYPVVVAIENGMVTGFSSLSPYRPRPAYSTTAEDSVYVAEDFRGKGIGNALMNEILDLGRFHGFHTIVARIVDEQEASIRLHRRCNFALVGVEREIGRKFGRWLNVAVMQHML